MIHWTIFLLSAVLVRSVSCENIPSNPCEWNVTHGYYCESELFDRVSCDISNTTIKWTFILKPSSANSNCNQPLLIPSQMTNVHTLDFSNLGINELILKSPQKNHSIKKINASRNRFSTIPAVFLKSFAQSTAVDFSLNQITTLNIICPTACKIKTLNLCANQINSINSDVFATMPDLGSLDLNYNKIKVFNPNLSSNNKLKWLNLSNNLIEKFTFAIFSSSIRVNLASNLITDLDVSCTDQNLCHFDDFTEDDYFERIFHFNASGNVYLNTMKILAKLGVALKTLNLSGNNVGTVTNEMLTRFQRLENLNLGRARIDNIEADSFIHLMRLKLLDLSYNKLSELKSVVFPITIEELNIEGNRLNEIDEISMENLPKLHRLAISHNDFECEYLKGFMSRAGQSILIRNTSTHTINVDGVDCHTVDSSLFYFIAGVLCNVATICCIFITFLALKKAICCKAKNEPVYAIGRELGLHLNERERFSVSNDDESLQETVYQQISRQSSLNSFGICLIPGTSDDERQINNEPKAEPIYATVMGKSAKRSEQANHEFTI